MVKRGEGGGPWITIIYITPVLINKHLVGRGEGGGGMDNDYLAPVFINKQLVKRGSYDKGT